MSTGVLLVGHGSRHRPTRIEHDAIEEMVRSELPDHHVASGFIELSQPPLALALREIAERCDHVIVVPLLLFAGGHMQRDIPAAIAELRTLRPNTRFSVSAPFGRATSTIDLVADQVLKRRRQDVPSACVLVGRGASEVEAQDGFQHVLDTLRRRAPIDAYRAAYCSVQSPNLADTLDAMVQQGARHVMVAPYLLFTGKLHLDLASTVREAISRHPTTQFELLGHLGPAVICAVLDAIHGALQPEVLSKS